ncbi:DNA-directed RNA polymerase III subunit RPC5 [Halotydeus destructor]|nr:DNA-directed RNA polymerase III subunit RPC5 [Halotydeus destructor]
MEDEVIKEFDVCINRSCGDIFLLRHSLKNSELNTAKFRVKPKNKLFELELDQARTRSRKRRVGADESDDEDQKQVMQSKRSVPVVSHAVGIIKSDISEIHFVPVDSVIQLKPALVTSTKPKVKSGDDEGDTSASDTEAFKPKQVIMRFAGPKEEENKKSRQMSFAAKEQREAAEKWLDTNYYPSTSEESHQLRKLIATVKPSDAMETDIDSDNKKTVSSVETIMKNLTCKYEVKIEPEPEPKAAQVTGRRRSSVKEPANRSPRRESPSKRRGKRQNAEQT